MADIKPTFELVFLGSGSAGSEAWVDLGVIPTGKQLWLGLATFISDDKAIAFEVRPNIPGQSAGDVANTQLRAMTSVPTGESRDIDFFFGGQVLAVAPVTAASTGVEKLWIRLRSKSNATGTFSYILFYTLY